MTEQPEAAFFFNTSWDHEQAGGHVCASELIPAGSQ